MRPVLLTAGVVGCAGILAVFLWSSHTNAAIGFETYRVGRTTILQRRAISGVLVPGERATVLSSVSGRVQKVRAHRDDVMIKNAVLVEIDSTRLQLDVERRQNALARAQVSLSKCAGEGNVAHASILSPDCRLDQLAFDLAAMEFKDAVRVRQQAVVRSPINGIVQEMNVSEGDWVVVGPNAPVATIISLDALAVDVEGDERDVFGITAGMEAQVIPELLDRTVLRGVVVEDPRLKRPRTSASGLGIFGLRVKLSDDGSKFSIGTSVRVEVEVGRKTGVLAVPKRALVEERRELGVIVVSGQGRSFRRISPGIEDEFMTEVLAGVAEGDAVLVGDANFLRAAIPSAASR